MGIGTNITLITLGIFVIVGVIIWVVVSTRGRRTVKVQRNLPMCINWMPEFCNGFVLGLEQKAPIRSNGRHDVHIIPIDYRLGEDEGIESKVTVQRMIVPQDNRISLASGEFSGEREIIIYLPKTMKHLAKKLRNTLLGDAMREASFISKVKDNIMRGHDEASRTQAKIVREYSAGELSLLEIERMEELNKQIQKLSPVLNELKKRGESNE